uniref:Uncharacterized protein n=1 Tax=Naja naja TaxID=35670 RepID=A0A8C6XVE6_NAJNA
MGARALWQSSAAFGVGQQRGREQNSLKQPLYLDASTSAFAHGIGHSSTGWVNHGHEAHKAEVVSGKVDIVAVKGEPFGILFFRQVIMAETWKGKKGGLQPWQLCGLQLPEFLS